jgi:MEMO1 family protein
MYKTNEKNAIRSPAVAGMFYEDSPLVLKKNIEGYLKDAGVPEIKGVIHAIISPHAGYVYSGFTAAHAYKILKGQKYDCVIAVGPSHREYFEGISIYPGDAYLTPLGEVKINKAVRTDLLKSSHRILLREEGHRSEHSIEVQLPFLQSVLGEFSFVPVIMGDQRAQFCIELADALEKASAKRRILLVASSDLSHFHPSEEAVKLDERVVSEVQNFDPEKFIEKLEEETFEACGGGPIAAVMQTARKLGANKVEILHYCNSGDITGDKQSVVGYLSAAFLQTA